MRLNMSSLVKLGRDPEKIMESDIVFVYLHTVSIFILVTYNWRYKTYDYSLLAVSNSIIRCLLWCQEHISLWSLLLLVSHFWGWSCQVPVFAFYAGVSLRGENLRETRVGRWCTVGFKGLHIFQTVTCLSCWGTGRRSCARPVPTNYWGLASYGN